MSKQLETAIAILTEIGIPADAITKLKSEKEEDVADIDVKVLKTDVFTRHKTALLSDDSFTKPIVDEARIGVLNSRANQLYKKFSAYVTKAEFDAIPDKNRYDDLSELIATRVEEKIAEKKPADNAQELKDMHDKLRERDEEIKKLREEEIPAIQTKFTQLEERKNLVAFQRNEFNKHAPNMVADPDVLWPAIQSHIESLYDFALNGTAMKVLNKGANTQAFDDKHNEINFESLMKGVLTEKKILKASNGEEKKEIIKEEKLIKPQILAPGLEKAKQLVADRAKEKAAA